LKKEVSRKKPKCKGEKKEASKEANLILVLSNEKGNERGIVREI
jgi:hypothetical protein